MKKVIGVFILVFIGLGLSFSYGQNRAYKTFYLSDGAVISGEVIKEIPYKTVDVWTFCNDTIKVDIKQIDSLAYLNRFPSRVRIKHPETLIDNKGTAWKGKVDFSEEKEQYILNTRCGDTFVFDKKEVSEIIPSKKKDKNSVNSDSNSIDLGVKVSQVWGIDDPAFDKFGVDRQKFDLMLLKTFKNDIGIGAGTGFRIYDYPSQKNYIIPLYATIQYAPSKHKINPIARLSTGINYQTHMGFRPVGLLLNTSVGLSYALDNGQSISLEFGFDRDKVLLYDAYDGNEQFYSSGFSLGLAYKIF